MTQADKATIVNAIRTYAELKHVMTARDRTMPAKELDIRSFFDSGTEGPVRALNSLRWLSRQGQLHLEGIRRAAQSAGSGGGASDDRLPGGRH